MSEPDFDIVKSDAGKKALKRVSQDFYNRSYLALWLFEVIGREWDETRKWTEDLKYEAFPQTCTWSISEWEKLYGIESDESLPLEYRRKMLMAKKIQRALMNPEIIRTCAEAFTGTNIDVIDPSGPYCFMIVIHPLVRDFNFKELQNYINTMKPSHLRAAYKFKKNTWNDAREKLKTWDNTKGLTWDRLANYRIERGEEK